MQVTARLKNLQVTPRKARLVAGAIVGMSVSAADIELSKQVKKTSEPMRKLLGSAVANAEHNFGLDRENLYVASVVVGDGMRLKRYRPRAFGRAAQIIRRFCHVTLIVEEVVEGLNRREVKQQSVKEPEAKTEETPKGPEEPSLLEGEEKKETKKGVALKAEAKSRQNVVKRTSYQRKSF
jgi:large subunit ribosomal protein L22